MRNESIIPIPDVRLVQDATACVLPGSDSNEQELVVFKFQVTASNPSRSVILSHRGFAPCIESIDTSLYLLQEPQSSVNILHAGQSGLGMFAVEGIDRGDLIVRERPLLVYPQAIPFHSNRPAGQEYPELEDAVNQLADHDRDAFFGLMNSHPQERSQIKGILDTNALHIGLLPGTSREYAAI